MIAAGKKEFRPANENSNCLTEDSSSSPDPVNLSHTVVPHGIDECVCVCELFILYSLNLEYVLVQSRRMSLRGETGPFTESYPQ